MRISVLSFIATQKDTYFRPHRHLTKSELALVLRGQFDVLTFDENGCVTGRYAVGSDTANIGFETPRGTWHTLLACTDGAVSGSAADDQYSEAKFLQVKRLIERFSGRAPSGSCSSPRARRSFKYVKLCTVWAYKCSPALTAG